MSESPPRYPPPPPPSQSPLPQSVWQGPYPTQQPPQQYLQRPSAYWPLTIISFLCSFIIGGVAMYFSAQVGNKWKAGDVAGSRKASQVALIVGIVGIVVGLIFFIALASADSSGYSY